MHEGRIASIDHFAGEGVRVMGLSYNVGSPFGTGALQPTGGGLTPLGRQAVARMNALGVTVDISHSSEAAGFDAMAASDGRTPGHLQTRGRTSMLSLSAARARTRSRENDPLAGGSRAATARSRFAASASRNQRLAAASVALISGKSAERRAAPSASRLAAVSVLPVAM